MKRFFLAPGSVQGRRMVFTGSEARHIAVSLRLKRGAEIVGFDGAGTEHTGTIAILSPRRVEAVITATAVLSDSAPVRIALAQALLKGGALDAVLRQATELGISDFYPLASRYTIPRLVREGEKRIERWRKISVDATRQSGRKAAPVVHPVREWARFLELAGEFDLALFPWEKERELNLRDAVSDLSRGDGPVRILTAVGPEGGFTEEEAAEAAEAGFTSVSLGPRILRAATAGVAAVAYLQLALGE